MNKRGLLFILVLTLWSPLFGTAQDSLQVRIDSAQVEVKSFDENLSEKYSGSEFDYENSVEGEAQNFIARAINWILNKIADTFGFQLDPTTTKVVEFVLYIILILGALYLVVRMLSGGKAAAFFSKNSNQLAALKIEDTHIETIDLDQLIKDALAQNNYRLAIRYMYLKVLKDLSFQNLITWHYDKTNLDYLRELTNPDLKSGFQKVSYLYDYVWYGEFEIDAEGFYTAQSDFNRFTKHIRNAG